MGYELEQLMRQYGVTAPTLAYGGMQAPIKPEEDMVVYRDGGGWKCGGLVKKYAEGGEVEADPMGGPNQGPRPLPQLSGGRNITTALAELIRQDAYSQGIENPVANFVGPRGTRFGLSPETPTPVPGAQAAGPVMNEGLLQLLDRYGQQTSPYEEELKSARARSEKETEAFTRLIEKMAGAPEAEPSKAEMYFRLAAAFGSPTKTGAFMENAAMASKEMADYQRDRSSRASESKKMQAQLMLEAQKARSQAARDEFTNLRQLAGEDTRSRAAFTRDLVKEHIASGKPQSEAGKAAVDAGLVRGTPEFNEFVNKYVQQKLESGNLFRAMGLNIQQQGLDIRREEAARLTPAEVKLKTETEDSVAGLESALSDLNRAFQLNPNTFGNTLVEKAQRRVLVESGQKDPRVQATAEVENLLGSQILSKLKSTFGAAPTEGERQILMDLEGAAAKTREERAAIIRRAYQAAKSKLERDRRRLQEVSSGQYRTTEPTPAPEQE